MKASSTIVLGERRFDHGDQQWFAAASGDRNPIHVDPVLSRRTLYGQPLVHGVHVVLWSLDAWCASSGRVPGRIVATFAKPIFVGETVQVVTTRSDDDSSELRVLIGDVPVMTLRVTHASRSEVTTSPTQIDDGAHTEKGRDLLNLDIAEMLGMTGTFEIARPSAFARTFKALGDQIGAQAVADLAVLSTLVGMECPGLHSVFGGFDVRLDPRADQPSGLAYEVVRADAHLSAVRMTVRSSSLEGSVTALARPRPVEQPSAVTISGEVTSDEFSDMRAVVVGGSRGIGETTAKIIAAGGGHVVLTWHRGEDDADLVAADIRSTGGSVDVVRLDVDEPATAASWGSVSHLFYFASPRITSRRLVAFEQLLFEGFVDAYVVGFARVVEALASSGADDLVAFYPSTVFVDAPTPEFVEYAAAKAAGEVAARALFSNRPSMSLLVERLPRLATDQTAMLAADSDSGASTVPTMVQIVRDTVRRHGSGRLAEGLGDQLEGASSGTNQSQCST